MTSPASGFPVNWTASDICIFIAYFFLVNIMNMSILLNVMAVIGKQYVFIYCDVVQADTYMYIDTINGIADI